MFWVVAILHILFIAAIAVRLKKYFYNAPLIDFYYSALFFKLFAGVMLGVIYFYYYGEDNKGDTIGYHEYAKIITHDIRHNMSDAVDFIFFNKYHDQYTVFLKGSNRVKFFVTIVSFFHLLTGDNYWLSSIYFSLLSFYGCWLLANHLIQYFKFSKVSIILSLLFFPSFVFLGIRPA